MTYKVDYLQVGSINSSGTVNATTGTFSGQVYTSGAFYTDGNRSVIRGIYPTLYFRDTDAMSAMIHNNSNLLYILRGVTDTEEWTQVNGQWPWYWNLANNDSTCGGSLYCVGNVTAYSERLKNSMGIPIPVKMMVNATRVLLLKKSLRSSPKL
jgi:hypothetical protein